MKKEIWKQIEEFDNYIVSSHGNVRRCKITGNDDCSYDIELNENLKPTVKKGYRYFTLSQNNVVKSLRANRIVAIAFLPNPQNKPEVNHKNLIKDDDNVSNLEWSTKKENVEHGKIARKVIKGRINENSTYSNRKGTVPRVQVKGDGERHDGFSGRVRSFKGLDQKDCEEVKSLYVHLDPKVHARLKLTAIENGTTIRKILNAILKENL